MSFFALLIMKSLVISTASTCVFFDTAVSAVSFGICSKVYVGIPKSFNLGSLFFLSLQLTLLASYDRGFYTVGHQADNLVLVIGTTLRTTPFTVKTVGP